MEHRRPRATKRGYATALVQKLRAEYGDGGFLHFGRASGIRVNSCHAGRCRCSGVPTASRLLDPRASPTSASRAPAPAPTASASCARWRSASAATDYIQAGYEDVWYYLWRERRLPVNVDPFDARLDDEMERARLRKVFGQKLDTVVGHVLPIKVSEGARRWPAAAGRPGPGSSATSACT